MENFSAPELAELDQIFLPTISDADLAALAAESPPMARRCSGCAYTAGTEANVDPVTAMVRDGCDRTGHPFWCHMQRGEPLNLPQHLCAGWMETRADRLKVSA